MKEKITRFIDKAIDKPLLALGVMGGLFLVAVFVQLVMTASPAYRLEAPKAKAINTQVDDEFFRLAPEKVVELPPPPEPVIPAEPPAPAWTEFFKPVTNDLTEEEKKMREIEAQLNRSGAVQVWYGAQSYMKEFKEQPNVKVKEAREQAEKDPMKNIGDRSGFCTDDKCTDASKATPLYRTLLRGSNIPAVLTEAIDSEIPSKTVRAEITQDVYAFMGSDILIPKNSIALGSYEAVDDIAQTRIPLVFDEIVTPNGVRILLTADAGDRTGAAGIPGTVDKRFQDKYATGLMFALAQAVVNFSVPTDNQNAANGAQALSDSLTPIIQEDVASRLDIKPRITVPAGEKVIIKPQAHLWFPELKNGTIVPKISSTLAHGENEQ